MSLLSHLSQNFFSNLFGRKKENKREVIPRENSNSSLSNNSIPSFSILNHSLSRNHESDYSQPSTLTKRENIFFGKDIDSNDTNEIIDYNLRRLRKNSEIIATEIETSTELHKTKNNDTNENDIENKLKTTDTTRINTDTNINNTNEKNKMNELKENKNNSDTDTNTDTDTETENENDNDLSSSSDSNTTENTVEEDKSTICTKQNQNGNNSSTSQSKKENKMSKHSSIDDIILEDFDLDKLIYNVPPPFIKVNQSNPMDSIPVIKFNDSISMPASLTMSKYRNTALSRSYNSRNILSSSVSSNGHHSQSIPGIRTIELKKPKFNNNNNNNNNKRRLSGVPIASSFSPKELSAPLSSSLLALQNEQPSFDSLICDETPSNDPSNESNSFYVIDEEDSEDDYDIFNYSMKEL